MTGIETKIEFPCFFCCSDIRCDRRVAITFCKLFCELFGIEFDAVRARCLLHLPPFQARDQQRSKLLFRLLENGNDFAEIIFVF